MFRDILGESVRTGFVPEGVEARIGSAELILDIPYENIITDGIKGVYNWKKTCEGCKKEFDEDYPFDDCEICGSKIFKKRIKVNK